MSRPTNAETGLAVRQIPVSYFEGHADACPGEARTHGSSFGSDVPHRLEPANPKHNLIGFIAEYDLPLMKRTPPSLVLTLLLSVACRLICLDDHGSNVLYARDAVLS